LKTLKLIPIFAENKLKDNERRKQDAAYLRGLRHAEL